MTDQDTADAPSLVLPRRRRPVAGVTAPPTVADGPSSALAARGSAAQGWTPGRDAGCPALTQAGAQTAAVRESPRYCPRRFLRPWAHVRRREARSRLLWQ